MLQDIFSGKKALFADGVQTVLRAHENRNRRVVLLKGNLVSNSRSSGRGISARVNNNGTFGFASIADYSSEAADKVIKAATENAGFLAGHSGRSVALPTSYGTGTIPLNDVIRDAEQKLIIEACKTVDEYVEKNCPGLTSRTVVYTEDSQERILYTSDAYDGHLVTPRCYMYVILNAESSDGVPVEMFKALGGYGSFFDNFADVTKYFPDIDELYKKVMDKKEGVYAEAGYKTVVLGGMMGGMLAHEAVGHTVEADLVKGGSVAGPSLNKRVASDLVTMVDFAHTYNGGLAPLPVYLDD